MIPPNEKGELKNIVVLPLRHNDQIIFTLTESLLQIDTFLIGIISFNPSPSIR